MEPAVAVTPQERPYRSHKVPACDLCRRRKIRCNIDLPNQPCRFCREKDSTCQYSRASPQPTGYTRSPHKRRRRDSNPRGKALPETTPNGLGQFPSIAGTSPDQSSLILNPPMAEDIEVLEHHLASDGSSDVVSTNPYRSISNTPGKPIIYLTVPRRRKGLVTATEPGSTQREVIEQVLGAHKNDVVNLYFEKLHPCFPVIDDRAFLDLWRKDPSKISSTLISDLYASALHFWRTSPRLRHHPRPDLAFIWNQAVAGIQEDFQGCTISTVNAALLDLIGRPVLSITGNIVMLGRVVALAHSLGLHRDPTSWKATAHEKSIRVRLWHGVLIHDCWSSLAHGTPPLIQRSNYDVPLPDIDCPQTVHPPESLTKSIAPFIYLCSLTKILGDVLPLVYALEPTGSDPARDLRKLECRLDDWEEALSRDPKLLDLPNGSQGNGFSSLHFCYLSVRLLLCRIAFKVALASQRTISDETKEYRLAMLRESAIAVIDYMTSVTVSQLEEFWLCYTAHILVTTTTILLRCILESSDPSIKRDCAQRLLRFQERIKTARDECDWDLAEFCLERCAEPIRKVAAALGVTSGDLSTQQSQNDREDLPPSHLELDASFASLIDEFLLPVDSFDYSFDGAWEEMPM